MDNMKIIQEPKIATQIIKALEGHDGNITINFHMTATQNERGGQGEVYHLTGGDDELLSLIDSFPPPKLRNFVDHIYKIALCRYGKIEGAAKLNVNWRTLRRVELGMEIASVGGYLK